MKLRKVKQGSRMNEVVLHKNPGIPSEHEMMVLHTMATQAVDSKMYRGIGEKSGVMMIMLSARELGIPCMQALNGGLNIIQGKVEISARMMSALIRRAGHQIKKKENTETRCVLLGHRGDTGEEEEVEFTIEEAQKAGLVKPGGGWTKWPKDMLFARTLSRLARQLFSDVIGIGYVEGEISATEVRPSEAEHIEVVDHVEVESEPECIDKYLEIFDKEDRHYALEYLRVVQNHFDWTAIQAVKELLKDEKRLFVKFQAWKEKFKEAA